MNTKFSDFVELSKVRIGTFIVIMTAMGFLISSAGKINWITLAVTLVGTFLCCSGSAMLNNFLERDLDALMERTKGRALPSGRLEPATVLGVGIFLVLISVAILVVAVNLLTGFLSLLTAFLYVLVYTPLKRLSTLNTLVGAIPGALPVVGGFAAASGEISAQAWMLFALMFIWQMPHFFSIAWLCREDYRKAGFQMLPSVEHAGHLTAAQIIAFSILLIPVSLFPLLDHGGGPAYAIISTLAAFYMIRTGLVFASDRSIAKARKVLHASLYYLPALLVGVALDRVLLLYLS